MRCAVVLCTTSGHFWKASYGGGKKLIPMMLQVFRVPRRSGCCTTQWVPTCLGLYVVAAECSDFSTGVSRAIIQIHVCFSLLFFFKKNCSCRHAGPRLARFYGLELFEGVSSYWTSTAGDGRKPFQVVAHHQQGCRYSSSFYRFTATFFSHAFD